MKLSNILIPFDAYERNKKISSLIGSKKSVLDVGGGATGVGLFANNKVMIADLEEGDIKGDARKLKLPKNSYDVVVCVDTIEHIPPKDRKKFVGNLVFIAKKQVIISAPFGSKKHMEAERNLLNEQTKKEIKNLFLIQHVKYGLPKPKEILPSKYKSEIFYAGDYRINSFLFKLQCYETKITIIDKGLLVVRGILNTLLNIFVYPFWFYKKECEYANRFYVVIKK